MMKFTFVLSITLCTLATPRSEAAIVVTVLDQTLAANTGGQAIDVLISSDLGDRDDIAGVNFRAFLGDGLGPLPEPIFAGGPTTDSADGGVLFQDGAGGRDFFFDAHPGGASDNAVFGNEQYQDSSFTFTTGEARPSGILATLFVDTTGIFSGTFALTLDGDPGIGFPSTELIASDSSSVTPTFVSGSITVSAVAVPEPASVFAMGIVSVGFLIRRKRLAKRIC